MTPEQRGPSRLGPVDLGRLWRPHHRLPPLRRRRHDAARTRRGGARRRARDRARSCRKPGRTATSSTPTFLDMVDAYVEAARPRSARRSRRPRDACPTRLASPRRCSASTSRAEGIGAVIWATGYGVDFGWIDIPVLDAQRRAGSPQRHHRRARPVFPRPAMAVEDEFLVPVGVGDDAAVLADHIAARG